MYYFFQIVSEKGINIRLYYLNMTTNRYSLLSAVRRMMEVAPMVNKVPSSMTRRSLSPRISLSTNVPV